MIEKQSIRILSSYNSKSYTTVIATDSDVDFLGEGKDATISLLSFINKLCCINDFFNPVTGFLQGDTLEPYLFILWLDNILQTSIDLIKENGFTLKKERSKQYSTKTITDTDYAKDPALLTNSPTKAESLLHSLEQPLASM